MVVFTCNHCGESLQKPKVAKHYDTTCRRNPINLTCVDCFTDFKLQEYVVHTKCLTEETRYSAKGTAAKILKGESKQTEWVNMVNKIIEEQKNAKPGIKNILQCLVNYDNIPRKKPRFFNFAKNVLRFKFNNNDLEEVWDILESHKNTLYKSKKEKVENGNGEISEQEKIEELEKKKSESEETMENGTHEGKNKENKQDQEKTQSNDVKKSKKKKKKSESEETVENGINEENKQEQEKTENLDESNQEKKSKKKKKKSESEETMVNTTNGVETSDDKTKKKRKSKQHDAETMNGTGETPQKIQKLNETTEENGVDSSKKKKKRKSLQEDESPQKKQKLNETSETNGVDNSSTKNSKTSECEETNDSKINDSQNESFSFKEVILEILRKKSKGLSGEALQNKVFKKYEAIMGPIENKESLLKKYNKKLKALKNISCDNDKYKLSNSE